MVAHVSCFLSLPPSLFPSLSIFTLSLPPCLFPSLSSPLFSLSLSLSPPSLSFLLCSLAAHALPEMYRPQQQPLPPQVTAAQEVLHGCYPGPYPPPPPMMHPPQPAPMMIGQKFGAQRPGFMPPRLQMPHPMFHPPPPPPPHHSNNSPFY